MLMLNKMIKEGVKLGDDIYVEIKKIVDGVVTLGISTPHGMKISNADSQEIYEAEGLRMNDRRFRFKAKVIVDYINNHWKQKDVISTLGQNFISVCVFKEKKLFATIECFHTYCDLFFEDGESNTVEDFDQFFIGTSFNQIEQEYHERKPAKRS